MNNPNIPFNQNQQMRRGISLNKRQFYVTISHPITERLCRSIVNVDGMLVRLDGLCSRRGISYEKFYELSNVLADIENVVREKLTRVYEMAGPAGNDLRNRRRKKQGKPANGNRITQASNGAANNQQIKAGPAETGPSAHSVAPAASPLGNGAVEPKAKQTVVLEDDASVPGFGDSRLPAVSAGPVALTPPVTGAASHPEDEKGQPGQTRSVVSPKRRAGGKEHAARN